MAIVNTLIRMKTAVPNSQLEKLDDVVYVGRPVFGQQDSTVQLFKVEPEGKYANKVKVTFVFRRLIAEKTPKK